MKYNRTLVTERLGDLRKDRALSYMKLSEGILEKTGVYISATQLQKYESTEKVTKSGAIKEVTDIMNVVNMIAIADYYEVSYDYLLGYSDSHKREHHDINKKTGLSEKAIEKLETWNELVDFRCMNGMMATRFVDTKAPEEISRIVESKQLSSLIAYIRSLKYVAGGDDGNVKNSRLGPSKIKTLKNEIGVNATREYIMFLIMNTFRDIVNEIAPFTPIENEVRRATPSDMEDL